MNNIVTFLIVTIVGFGVLAIGEFIEKKFSPLTARTVKIVAVLFVVILIFSIIGSR